MEALISPQPIEMRIYVECRTISVFRHHFSVVADKKKWQEKNPHHYHYRFFLCRHTNS